jgi:hypothetical protein
VNTLKTIAGDPQGEHHAETTYAFRLLEEGETRVSENAHRLLSVSLDAERVGGLLPPDVDQEEVRVT